VTKFHTIPHWIKRPPLPSMRASINILITGTIR
jgi:hypothetical protein